MPLLGRIRHRSDSMKRMVHGSSATPEPQPQPEPQPEPQPAGPAGGVRSTRLAARISAAFTDRAGGVSEPPYDTRNLGGGAGDDPAAVRQNREKTAAELGIGPGRVVFMRQVHGADVRYVAEPFHDVPPALDAVFTDEPGLALAVLVADCAPVLVADPIAGMVGAAHSGRAGTAAGVVAALVRAMAERDARPARMVALIGPSACGRCYEVPAELRDEVASVLPETWSTTRRGTPALDLRAGIATQLAAAGVRDVRHDDRCTIETPELYSYRRDKRTGRFAGYVWLEA
jgi:polyphenol oxidase